MRRSRAPSNWPGPFFAARSWAGCTTNMFGFDLRQAQAILPSAVEWPGAALAPTPHVRARSATCYLRFRSIMLGPGKPRDVSADILKRNEVAATRQRNRIPQTVASSRAQPSRCCLIFLVHARQTALLNTRQSPIPRPAKRTYWINCFGKTNTIATSRLRMSVAIIEM